MKMMSVISALLFIVLSACVRVTSAFRANQVISGQQAKQQVEAKEDVATVTVPSLQGLWQLKRSSIHDAVTGSRYYDVLQADNTGEKFLAFPLTDCLEGGEFNANITKMECSRTMELTVSDRGDGAATVSRKKAGGFGVVGGPGLATVTSSLSADGLGVRRNLEWQDKKIWSPVDYAPSPLDFLDDAECRALDAVPGVTSSPLEFSIYFGASASLSFKNIPGVTADNFNCIANSWLERHQKRFRCILEKALQSQNHSSSASSQMISRALGQMDQALSGQQCVPHICIGFSFTTWPIPSPLPTISVFVVWPRKYSDCNGVNLKKEMADVLASHGEEDAAKFAARAEEADHMGGISHGLSFTVFPVPEVAYFAMGTANLGSLARRLLGPPDMSHVHAEEPECPDMVELDSFIQQSLKTCKSIAKRFELRARQFKVVDWRESLSTRRMIAGSFPELGKTHPKAHSHFDAHLGGYGQIGITGVAGGIYGGTHFNVQALWTNFRGCEPWKKVVSLWHSNPLFERDPVEIMEMLPECNNLPL